MFINEQELKEWQAHNELLQEAYHDRLHAITPRERDAANVRIQRILEWRGFADFCYRNSAPINGISRYGLDSGLEQCIDMIDKIANGEMEFNM